MRKTKTKSSLDVNSPHYEIDHHLGLEVTKAMGAVGVTGNQAIIQRHLIYGVIAYALRTLAPESAIGQKLRNL